MFFSDYVTYAHMLVVFNFALSTHLTVYTGCPFYLYMSYFIYISSLAYLPEMYACAYGRCAYGYVTMIYVIILSSQFYNYIDHTLTIVYLWPTISSS